MKTMYSPVPVLTCWALLRWLAGYISRVGAGRWQSSPCPPAPPCWSPCSAWGPPPSLLRRPCCSQRRRPWPWARSLSRPSRAPQHWWQAGAYFYSDVDDNQSANHKNIYLSWCINVDLAEYDLHCVGAYIQRDIYPDAKKMLDEYNAAWYNTDEESSEDLL